jgi:ADP-heptose:LPS heptosyltransferase
LTWFLTMLRDSPSNGRSLLIQLARLGDLVQSLPAVEALQEQHPDRPLDFLCPSPMAPILSGCRSVHRVLPWDGMQWRSWANQWTKDPTKTLGEVKTYLGSLRETQYAQVFNLNQHAKALLMAHLFTDRDRPSAQEDHGGERVTPWAQYLRQVAQDRGGNRVHLADAWCGLCDVKPRGRAPYLHEKKIDLPVDLAPIGESDGLWIALVTGTGDPARCIAPAVWALWIRRFLEQVDVGQVVLIGSGHERETGQAILEAVPPLLQGRVWDTTGRTGMAQLMRVLKTCHWTIGGDTGPLHLATVVGGRALGFYVARARVHETGPYGKDHWVYQHSRQDQPDSWPIMESIELICDNRRRAAPGWTLWNSHMDGWGVFYDDGSGGEQAKLQRAAVWRSLSPALCEPVAA